LAVATVHGGRTLAAVVRAGSAAVISGSTYVRPGSVYVIPGLHLNSSRGSPYPRRPRIPLVDGGMLALTARLGIRSRPTRPTLEGAPMKTSLGIWAFGPMITRFVPAGYQPEHSYEPEPVAEKVHRAVEGLGDLIDGYEFHYPDELSPS